MLALKDSEVYNFLIELNYQVVDRISKELIFKKI